MSPLVPGKAFGMAVVAGTFLGCLKSGTLLESTIPSPRLLFVPSDSLSILCCQTLDPPMLVWERGRLSAVSGRFSPKHTMRKRTVSGCFAFFLAVLCVRIGVSVPSGAWLG